MQNQMKGRENPMISLTGGGMKTSKKHMQGKRSSDPASITSGVTDSDRQHHQAEVDQPDNEYLETMKQRMRGLPDLTKSANNIQ